MPLLFWSLTGAVILHIIEEFVFPGGFKAWYQIYKPELASSITKRFLITINALLIIFSVLVGLAGSAPKGNGVAAWLTLAALLFSNALLHIHGAMQTLRYSPGMISGLLLYLPLAVYGFAHCLLTGQASLGTALIAALIGSSYQFISDTLHRRRARTTPTK